MTIEKAAIIDSVCEAISRNELASAADIIKARYRFDPPPEHPDEAHEPVVPMAIFMRDGFIDRYTGLRLVFPGALRVISMRLPQAFPYHRNWKMDECHFAYYELFPVLDHILPRARGGKNVEENLATTSTVRNSAKANFTLDELGWPLLEVINSRNGMACSPGFWSR